jgi:hypothetical protein
MVSTRLFQVENQIRKRHGGSIGEVTMCFNTYRKDLILHDKSLTLRDCGIVAACEAVLLYDFVPISHPLLTHDFTYKTDKKNDNVEMLTKI